MSAKIQGQVISFYSYKGGTGRTMALANVATLLSNRNKVLMIDWDLEAPSLHYFFGKQEPLSRPGLIDFFEDVKSKIETNEDLRLEENSAILFESIDFGKYIYEIDGNPLFLMAAGTRNDSYGHQVTSFRWVDFFNQVPWFFKYLAQYVCEKYDYVLIDSRTGLNDISGICTALLPDKLVAVFTPNKQSISGLLDMVKLAVNYRANSDDLRSLSVFPLPSRIELQEKELLDEWRFGNEKQGILGYQSQIEELLKQLYKLEKCDLTNYLNEVQIQQQTYYAYGESIAVLDKQGSGRLSLKTSYEEFEKRLINTVAPWVDIEIQKVDLKSESIIQTSQKVEQKPSKSIKLPVHDYDVFISYNSVEREAALGLARQLTDSGLSVWFDVWRLIPGKPWQEAIEKALMASRYLVVLIGKNGFGKWENEEMRVASESQVSNSKRNVIPVLLPGADPNSIQEKLLFTRNTWVDLRNGLIDRDAIARLVSGIKQQEPGDLEYKDLLSESFIPFTDREDEIDAIRSSSSAQYFLIHAPSGYGKSTLLRQLNHTVFEKKNWHHAYVSVSKEDSLNDIAVNLGEGLKVSVNRQKYARPGLKLGLALKNYYSDLSYLVEKFSGLVLLIDLDKESSPEMLGKILEEFIPDIKKTIDTLRQFNNGDLLFRVIVAGRYLAMTKEAKSTSLPLDQRALTPFTYNVVKMTVYSVFPQLIVDERCKLAAHITYMTGGHPASMAKMFLLYKRNPISVDEFIDTCKQDVQSIIAFTVEEVQESLPRGNDSFIKALESLMVFRYVNYSILDAVRNKYQLQVGDTFDYEDILTKNHLFTRKRPYTLQEDVVRRLISAHLREFQPDVYRGYCSEARKLCENILQGEDVPSPTEWTLEYLFQWLQEQSAKGIDSEEKRLNLRSEFLDDVLPLALNLYLRRHASLTRNTAKEDQSALISELSLPRQWEFEFSVNYLLREDLFDGAPYKELESKIAKFFEGKLKELEV